MIAGSAHTHCHAVDYLGVEEPPMLPELVEPVPVESVVPELLPGIDELGEVELLLPGLVE